MNTVFMKERALHLQANPEDVGNGFCPPRTLYNETMPMEISVPRTRADFYPPSLSKDRRKLTEPYRQLLRDLWLGAKSFAELGRTIRPEVLETWKNALLDMKNR